MTYVQNVDAVNQIKKKIAKDIESKDIVNFDGQKCFLYIHTYALHKIGKKIHDDGKKKYRPHDCINPGTNKYFNREEARVYVAFLIKKFKFFENQEDLRGKVGWFSQDEEGFPKAFIFFKKSKKEKDKSLYIKFNVQFVQDNPLIESRSHYIVNMLSFHPSYGI